MNIQILSIPIFSLKTAIARAFISKKKKKNVCILLYELYGIDMIPVRHKGESTPAKRDTEFRRFFPFSLGPL